MKEQSSKLLSFAVKESYAGCDSSKASTTALQHLRDLLGPDEGTRRLPGVGRAHAQRRKSLRALCSKEGAQLLINLQDQKVGPQVRYVVRSDRQIIRFLVQSSVNSVDGVELAKKSCVLFHLMLYFV